MSEIHSLGKSDIKINNRILVLNLIKQYHAISRIQLSKITSMSPTSMTRIVNDLKELNLVCEVDTASNPLGRKATMIGINKDAFYSLGVTLSKDGIRLVLIDTTYAVLYAADYKQELEGLTSNEIAEHIYLKYPEFMFEAEKSTSLELRKDLSCIGIGYPGMVDDTHKRIITSPIIGEDVNHTFCHELSKLFHLPVYVENDIKAALYNEYQRFGEKGEDNLAYLYLDMGLGVALMVNGKVYRGNAFGAGEVAYSALTKEQLPACFFNLTYPRIMELAEKEGISIDSLTELQTAYKAGKSKTTKFLVGTASRLSHMLNLINVFYNPSKIIVGGSVIRDLPAIVSMAASNKEAFYDVLYKELQIVISHEPTGGEAIGAAIVALDEYVKEQLTDKWY